MEIAQGKNLAQIMKPVQFRGISMSENDIAEMIFQLADGLRYLHIHGIVHRDVKPDNIFVVDIRGRTVYKLGDFGCTRNFDETVLKTQVGTPVYYSPEVIECGAYTEKSDIWSLGVTIYEAVANIYPFGDKVLIDMKG